MTKLKFTILLIFNLLGFVSFAQKEANIWYFGNQAGLDFNSGDPVALTDSALPISEDSGSASFSDQNGNLLFYSDGKNILNKNHEPMLNGILLPQYTTKGMRLIIVPKPGNSSIYYLFYTGLIVDVFYSYNTGLRYSEIDMSLDNGLGGVTASKKDILINEFEYNAHEYNLSATLHSNGQDIWLVFYEKITKTFYSFLISNSGINMSPVTSTTGFSRFPDIMGETNIKLSPNGKKLVLTDLGDTHLYNFDNDSGHVANNPVVLKENFDPRSFYAEFSSSGNVLYISAPIRWGNEARGGALYQYDLNSPIIPDSKVTLAINPTLPSLNDKVTTFADMQIGTDQKIYISLPNSGYLAVINSPETLGLGCDLDIESMYLNGRHSQWEMPHFILNMNIIDYEGNCYGDNTNFKLKDPVDSVVWNFGDPTTGVNNTSTDIEPTHVFSSPGIYEVSVTATIGSESYTETATVGIFEKPVAYPVDDQIVCISKETGGSFDLLTLDQTVLNGQDPNLFNLTYYVKIGSEPYDYAFPSTIYPTYHLDSTKADIVNVRVTVNNINHPECEDSVYFNVLFIEVPNINETITDLTACDDMSVGTDTDGLIMFDLTQKETEILNEEMVSDFIIKYFKDADLTDEIMTPDEYTNTASDETIYAEVANKIYPDCKALTSFKLKVFDLPTISPLVELKQCDDDLDGFTPFNLNQVIDEILLSHNNETVAFYETEADAISDTSPIVNTMAYWNKTASFDTVWSRIENDSECFKTSQIDLTVTTTEIPDTFVRYFESCDDSSNGISIFDFSSVEDEILSIFPNPDDLLVSFYRNEADALTENNAIVDISSYSNFEYPYNQDIYVRLDSKTYNDCVGLGKHIHLIVKPLPDFIIESPQFVCSYSPTSTVTLDPLEANLSETFTYSWTFNGIEIATSSTLNVSAPGNYSVTLTKTDGTGCSRTEIISVIDSETATITQNDVSIVDLSDINSLSIKNPSSLGSGDYWFSLESNDGEIVYPYQDEPIFNNLKGGTYTLYVADKNGCGIATLPISVIGYPKFFTPNNDGVNDFWQIQGISNLIQPNSSIHIFDRYGKLLKQLSASEVGWDGTFNGNSLSMDDYWFRLFLEDGRTVLGHFALKR